MTKIIRILAIICLALVVVSLFLTGLCILLQKPLIELFYGKSFGAVTMMVPFSPLVNGLCTAVTFAALCFVAGNKKLGIWSDLIMLAAVVLVLPGLNTALSFLQSTVGVAKANAYGTAAVAANAAVTNLCSFAMAPGNLGMRLALVVCGMSLVFKLMEKKKTL